MNLQVLYHPKAKWFGTLKPLGSRVVAYVLRVPERFPVMSGSKDFGCRVFER